MDFFKKAINKIWSYPVFSIAFGGALAQFLQLIAYPFLTRLYTPEDFGGFFFATSIIVVLVVFFVLQFDSLIIASPRWLVPLLVNVSFVFLFFGFLLLQAIVLINIFLCDLSYFFFRNNTLLIYLPFALVVHGVYAVGMAKCVRFQEYKRIGLSNFCVSFSCVLIQIILGVNGFGIVGLIFGDFICRVVGSIILFRGKKHLHFVGFKKIFFLLRRFKDFSLFLTPAAVLNVFSQNIQAIFFPIIYGGAQAGQLGVANKLIVAPVGLVVGAVGQVFNGEVKNQKKHEGRKNVFLMTLVKSTKIAIPIAFVIGSFSEILFSLFLGSSWGMAGVYASILSIGICFSIVVSPVSGIFIINKSLKSAFIFSIIEVVLRSFPFFMGYFCESISALQVVILISFCNALLYGIGLFRMLHVAEVDFIEFLSKVKVALLYSFLFFTPCLGLRVLEFPIYIVMFFSLLAVVLYFLKLKDEMW